MSPYNFAHFFFECLSACLSVWLAVCLSLRLCASLCVRVCLSPMPVLCFMCVVVLLGLLRGVERDARERRVCVCQRCVLLACESFHGDVDVCSS